MDIDLPGGFVGAAALFVADKDSRSGRTDTGENSETKAGQLKNEPQPKVNATRELRTANTVLEFSNSRPDSTGANQNFPTGLEDSPLDAAACHN
jgi:hypothetical protein